MGWLCATPHSAFRLKRSVAAAMALGLLSGVCDAGAMGPRVGMKSLMSLQAVEKMDFHLPDYINPAVSCASRSSRPQNHLAVRRHATSIEDRFPCHPAS